MHHQQVHALHFEGSFRRPSKLCALAEDPSLHLRAGNRRISMNQLVRNCQCRSRRLREFAVFWERCRRGNRSSREEQQPHEERAFTTLASNRPINWCACGACDLCTQNKHLVARTFFTVLSVFVVQRTIVHPTHTRWLKGLGLKC